MPASAAKGAFLTALDTALARIRAFAPDTLVIALGLDAFEGDPFGGLAISTEGYGRIAAAIAKAYAGPTVIIQEGGYLCDELGANLSAFLKGFEAAR
jgi:acetoin utilization deacetylase AcuC-like enzyme